MGRDHSEMGACTGEHSAVNRVHLFEPTGYGGIFQHALRIGQIVADAGAPVTLHTSDAHEATDPGGVSLCCCAPWRPRASRPRFAAVPIAARYCGRTVPHLVNVARDGGVVHIQGLPSATLTTFTVLALRARRRPLVLSPHNTFSHRNSRLEKELIRLCARLAGVNIAFSQPDATVLSRWGVRVLVSPLVQLAIEPEPRRVERWRRTWTALNGEDVILFAGQIRADKRLDILIEAAAAWPRMRKLAIVGEDRGDWERCRRFAARRGVTLHASIGYVAIEDFVAAIAAADLVVAPHQRASQSGVLVHARDVGTATVASRIGGLGELSSETFPPLDVAALRSAIDSALKRDQLRGRGSDIGEACAVHLHAYRVAAERPGRERIDAS